MAAEEGATANFHFTQDLPSVLPQMVGELEQGIARVKSAAGQAERIEILGQLAPQIEEVVGLLSTEVPQAAAKARDAIQRGVAPAQAFAPAITSVETLGSNLTQLKRLLDEVNFQGFGQRAVRAVADANAAMTTLKSESKEVGAKRGDTRVIDQAIKSFGGTATTLGVTPQQARRFTENLAKQDRQVVLGTRAGDSLARQSQAAAETTRRLEQSRRQALIDEEIRRRAAQSDAHRRPGGQGTPSFAPPPTRQFDPVDPYNAPPAYGQPYVPPGERPPAQPAKPYTPPADLGPPPKPYDPATYGQGDFERDYGPKPYEPGYGKPYKPYNPETHGNDRPAPVPSVGAGGPIFHNGAFISPGMPGYELAEMAQRGFDGNASLPAAYVPPSFAPQYGHPDAGFEQRVREELAEAQARAKPAAPAPAAPASKKLAREALQFSVTEDAEKRTISARPAGADPRTGAVLSNIDLDPKTGEIKSVFTHPEYRRQGVASHVLDYAREQGFNPQHSADRTAEGSAFAAATGGYVPPLRTAVPSFIPEVDPKAAEREAEFQRKLEEDKARRRAAEAERTATDATRPQAGYVAAANRIKAGIGPAVEDARQRDEARRARNDQVAGLVGELAPGNIREAIKTPQLNPIERANLSYRLNRQSKLEANNRAAQGIATPAERLAAQQPLDPNETVRLYRGEKKGDNGEFYSPLANRAAAYTDITDRLGGIRSVDVTRGELDSVMRSNKNRANVKDNGAYVEGDVILPKRLRDQSAVVRDEPPHKLEQLIDDLRRQPLAQGAGGGIGAGNHQKSVDVLLAEAEAEHARQQAHTAAVSPQPVVTAPQAAAAAAAAQAALPPTQTGGAGGGGKPPTPPPTPAAAPGDAGDPNDPVNRIKAALLGQGSAAGPPPGSAGSTSVQAPLLTDEAKEEAKQQAKIDAAHARAQKAADEGKGTYTPGGTIDDLVSDEIAGKALPTNRRSKFGGRVYAVPGQADPVANPTGLFEALPPSKQNPGGAIVSHSLENTEAELRVAESLTRTFGGLNRVASTLAQALGGLTPVGAALQNKVGSGPATEGSFDRQALGVQGGGLSAQEEYDRRVSRLTGLNSPGGRLHGIEGANPTGDGETRQLSARYVQVGDSLRRVVNGSEQEIDSIEHLTEARLLLERFLKKEAEAAERAAAADERRAQAEQRRAEAASRRSSVSSGGHNDEPSGFFAGVVGGAGGHGFGAQAFDISKVPTNLGSTLGVVARYSAEYAVYQKLIDGAKAVFTQTEQLNHELILLGNTLEATGAQQVDLNSAFAVGAKFGLSEAESVQAGTAGIKAYHEELANGASSAEIFTKTVQAAGTAALITGQDMQTSLGQLTAITKQFNTGSEGLNGVNDSLLAASSRYNVKPADIAQGVSQAGDLANAGGFSQDLLFNTVGAVNQATNKQSGEQLARELGQGGSARTRAAVQQLGVNYDSGNVPGSIEKAAVAYAKLTQAQQANFAVSLGGARTAETQIALLKEFPSILEATNEAYREGGKEIQYTVDEQNTFTGQLKQIGAAGKALAADLGKTGILDFFGLLLAAIKPAVQGLDDLVKLAGKFGTFPKSIPGLGGHGIGDAAGLGVGYLAFRGIRNSINSNEPGPLARRVTAVQNFARTGAVAETAAVGAAGAAGVAGRAATGAALSRGAQAAAVDAETLALNQRRLAVLQALGVTEKKLTDTTVAEATSGAELNASLKRLIVGTNEATGAVSRLTLASRQGAVAGGAGGIVASGKTAEKGSILVGAEQAAGPSALSRAGRALLPSSTGATLGAVIGIPILIDAISSDISKTKDILASKDAAKEAGRSGFALSSNDPQALRDAAKSEDEAATKASTSSGGLLGTIENYFSGGNKEQIELARESAKINNDLADKIDKITEENSAQGQYRIDTSSVDALDNSLSAIQKAGAGSTDQLKALQHALEELTETAGSATGVIHTQAEIQIAGVVGGAAAKKGIAGNLQGYKDDLEDAKSDVLGTPENDARQALDKAGIKTLEALNPDTVGAISSDFTAQYLKDHPKFNPKDNLQQADFGHGLIESLRSDPDFAALSKADQGAITSLIKNNILNSLKNPKQTVAATQATIVDDFNKTVAAAQTTSQNLGITFDAGAGFGFTDQGKADQAAIDRGKGRIAADEKRIKDINVQSNRAQDKGGRAAENFIGRADGQITALRADQKGAEGDIARAQAGYKNDEKAFNNDPNQPSGQVIAAKDFLTKVTAAAEAAKHSKTPLTPSQVADINAQVYAAQIAYGQAQQQNLQNQVAIDQSFLSLTDKIGREQVDLAKSVEAASKLTGQARQTAEAQNRQKAAQLQQDQASQIGSDLLVGTTGTLNKQTGLVEQSGDYNYDPTDTLTNDTRQADADRISLSVLGAQERSSKNFKGYSDTYNKLYMKVRQEDATVAQDYVAGANANIAAAADPASAIDSATSQMQQAINTSKLYRVGSAQWKQQQAALKAGYVALIKAQVEDSKNIFLLNHDQTDEVQVAAANVYAANEQLAKDQARGAKPEVIRADTLAKNTADEASQKSGFDRFLADNQTNYDLHRQSFTTYLRNLQGRDALLKAERAGLSKTSEGYRQLTDEINQTEQSILQATTSLQGQFNLGDIKVPTVYEVRRQVATGNANVGYSDNRTTSITINGIGSTHEVVQIVKQQLGSHATVTRAPVASRKV